jgi:hypothetical protein
MRSRPHAVLQANSPGTFGHARLLKNGAAAHEFTRDDRAKGGRVRAGKIRRRKALQARFDVATLEDLDRAELELAERAIVRLGLLLASEDDRVAMRACKEVFDRVLGRPRERQEHRGLISSDTEAEVAVAREKLAILIERRAQAIAKSGIP